MSIYSCDDIIMGKLMTATLQSCIYTYTYICCICCAISTAPPRMNMQAKSQSIARHVAGDESNAEAAISFKTLPGIGRAIDAYTSHTRRQLLNTRGDAQHLTDDLRDINMYYMTPGLPII